MNNGGTNLNGGPPFIKRPQRALRKDESVTTPDTCCIDVVWTFERFFQTSLVHFRAYKALEKEGFGKRAWLSCLGIFSTLKVAFRP